jgi:RNA recognition motif-containing protein
MCVCSAARPLTVWRFLFPAQSRRSIKEIEKMEAKLYVGNLSYSTSEDELRTLFAQAGTVTSVAVIMDRMTGASKGFGFIEMATEAEAQKAITMFSEYKMGDRALLVNIAKPRVERSGGGGRNRF